MSTDRRGARFRDIVAVLMAGALKTRYRGSVLGVLWSAVSPLAMATLYTVILGRAFAPYYGSALRYGVAVYVGLTVIGTFIGATSQALPSIVQNAALLNKIRIPFAAFPLATISAFGVQQVVGTLPVVTAFTLAFTHDPLRVLLLAVPLAALAILTLGIALLTSALCVYFRDAPYLYDLLTFVLWVTTPVMYPAAVVPAAVLAVLRYNPLFGILETSRTIVLTTRTPDVGLLGLCVAEATIVALASLAAYRALRPQFMDRVG